MYCHVKNSAGCLRTKRRSLISSGIWGGTEFQAQRGACAKAWRQKNKALYGVGLRVCEGGEQSMKETEMALKLYRKKQAYARSYKDSNAMLKACSYGDSTN